MAEWIRRREEEEKTERIERMAKEEEAQKKREEERTLLVHEIKRNNETFYIKVDYSKDRATAKALGAWWDNDVRSRYIRSNSMNIYTLLEKYYKFK